MCFSRQLINKSISRQPTSLTGDVESTTTLFNSSSSREQMQSTPNSGNYTKFNDVVLRSSDGKPRAIAPTFSLQVYNNKYLTCQHRGSTKHSIDKRAIVLQNVIDVFWQI